MTSAVGTGAHSSVAAFRQESTPSRPDATGARTTPPVGPKGSTTPPGVPAATLPSPGPTGVLLRPPEGGILPVGERFGHPVQAQDRDAGGARGGGVLVGEDVP